MSSFGSNLDSSKDPSEQERDCSELLQEQQVKRDKRNRGRIGASESRKSNDSGIGSTDSAVLRGLSVSELKDCLDDDDDGKSKAGSKIFVIPENDDPSSDEDGEDDALRVQQTGNDNNVYSKCTDVTHVGSVHIQHVHNVHNHHHIYNHIEPQHSQNTYCSTCKGLFPVVLKLLEKKIKVKRIQLDVQPEDAQSKLKHAQLIVELPPGDVCQSIITMVVETLEAEGYSVEQFPLTENASDIAFDVILNDDVSSTRL